jgi:hypothetical protein
MASHTQWVHTPAEALLTLPLAVINFWPSHNWWKSAEAKLEALFPALTVSQPVMVVPSAERGQEELAQSEEEERAWVQQA